MIMIQQQLLSLPKIPPIQLLFIAVPPCMSSGEISPPCYHSMALLAKGDRNLRNFDDMPLTSTPPRVIMKAPIRHYKINERGSLRPDRRHAPVAWMRKERCKSVTTAITVKVGMLIVPCRKTLSGKGDAWRFYRSSDGDISAFCSPATPRSLGSILHSFFL